MTLLVGKKKDLLQNCMGNNLQTVIDNNLLFCTWFVKLLFSVFFAFVGRCIYLQYVCNFAFYITCLKSNVIFSSRISFLEFNDLDSRKKLSKKQECCFIAAFLCKNYVIFDTRYINQWTANTCEHC